MEYGLTQIDRKRADDLWAQFEHTGNESLLGEVIHLNLEWLTLYPHDYQDHALYCAELAALLLVRSQNTGDRSLLDEAVDLEREAIKLRPEILPDSSSRHASDKESLWERFHSTGDAHLLQKAIDLQREAIILFPRGHSRHPTSCANLASSLWTQYRFVGGAKLLEEANELERVAMSLRGPDHPHYANSCTNLACSLWKHYDVTGEEKFLEEAIGLLRASMDLRPRGHPSRAFSCTNLATALISRFNHSGDEDSINEAIDLSREAMFLRPKGHPHRVFSCANLSSALSTRYKATRDESLLNEAIDYQRELVRLQPTGSPEHAPSCANLSGLLLSRYHDTGNEELVKEAIDLGRKALAAHVKSHPDRGHFCGSLAGSLFSWYKCSGDLGFLDEAICLQREALNSLTQSHRSHYGYRVNLTVSLWERYKVTNDQHLIDESIGLLRTGLALVPEHEQWRSTIQLSRIYLHQNNLYSNVPLAIQFLTQTIRSDPSSPLEVANQVMAQLNDVRVYSLEGKYSVALITVYQELIQILPLLINPVFEIAVQLRRLRNVRQLGGDAFVNAVLAGHWSTGLENLEMVQGAIWANRLNQVDPQLKNIPRPSAIELESCLRALSGDHTGITITHNRFSVPQDVLYKNSSRMFAIIRELRTIPGLERFMLGETSASLCAATVNHPAVVLVGARNRFYALIIVAGGILGKAPMELDLTEQELHAASLGTQRLHRGASSSVKLDDAERGPRISYMVTPVNHYLRVLWTKVVEPILKALKLQPSSRGSVRPRLYWCPTGPFISMPLHAAGIYEGPERDITCCADYIVSSYTPTLSGLLRAQNSAPHLPRHSLALTLVAEMHAQEQLARIPGVYTESQEITIVAGLNDVKIVGNLVGTTTIVRAFESMKMANIVHLACHGVQDHEDATKSGFCLGDGRLTISDLMKLRMKDGFLAFLSACETASGSKDQPDQAMHLAAAMLFTGFKSVIATMWAIADEDGPTVAKWFYEELFARDIIDADSVAYALDRAVSQLRKSGVPARRWIPFIHMGA